VKKSKEEEQEARSDEGLMRGLVGGGYHFLLSFSRHSRILHVTVQ